ncbi:hypothetical protein [Dyadobacter diqingensis]|uniref:hypothetical protein n=1 Tax=Dyadobacter diqingensis TaxID=2938121 RepID=UPI0020C2DE94|nr:hypothetical protein [Dyadobacter diqingensis]
MKLKLSFETDKSFNFQFGDVNVKVGPEETEVGDEHGKALLEQFPHWFEQVPDPQEKQVDTTEVLPAPVAPKPASSRTTTAAASTEPSK